MYSVYGGRDRISRASPKSHTYAQISSSGKRDARAKGSPSGGAGWWGGFYLCEKRVLNHQNVFGLHVAVKVPTLVHEGQAVKNLLAIRRQSHSSRGARVFQASEQDTR